MAGGVVPADALADRPGAIDEALAAYEARLRPWPEAAQRIAKRNVVLLTPANRFQLLARGAVLRVAARPFLTPVVKRLLDQEGERLYGRAPPAPFAASQRGRATALASYPVAEPARSRNPSSEQPPADEAPAAQTLAASPAREVTTPPAHR